MNPAETAAILRQFNEWRRGDEDIPQFDPREIGEAIDAAVDMIERLEAAEKDVALKEQVIDALGSELNAVANERDAAELMSLALRTKIAEMEQQEPVAWMQSTHLSSFKNRLCGSQSSYVHCSDHQLHPDFKPLYAIPGAQPAPSEQDESVRKSWARFSNELHRSPDAPYPGMSEAFERHFSQSFTDRDWRAESGAWAAAWKAAKRHGAQPAQSVPDVDALAQFIREIDGKHQLGAGALAERIVEWLAADPEAKP